MLRDWHNLLIYKLVALCSHPSKFVSELCLSLGHLYIFVAFVMSALDHHWVLSCLDDLALHTLAAGSTPVRQFCGSIESNILDVPLHTWGI